MPLSNAQIQNALDLIDSDLKELYDDNHTKRAEMQIRERTGLSREQDKRAYLDVAKYYRRRLQTIEILEDMRRRLTCYLDHKKEREKSNETGIRESATHRSEPWR